MLVRDLMSREVVKIQGDLPVADLCDLFEAAHVHGAAVVDSKGRLVGFVSQEDILVGSMGRPLGPSRGSNRPPSRRRGKKEAQQAVVSRVRDIMTAPAVSASEETDVRDLCRMMWRLRIHHVPIVRRNKVTGIVSTLDICRAIAEGTIRFKGAPVKKRGGER